MPDKPAKECPSCGGDGEVVDDSQGYAGDQPIVEFIPCPDCHGSGSVQPPGQHNLLVWNLLRLVEDHREKCDENCTVSLMIVKQAVLAALDEGDELTDEEVRLFF